jgi:S-adenosylmethionine:tRNA ribosyltransferase-isomerase
MINQTPLEKEPVARNSAKHFSQSMIFKNLPVLDFKLPAGLEAAEPPEARGLTRDQVRLMVSYLADRRILHTEFRQLPDFLNPGDVLVINTSGTLNAALNVRLEDGTALELHLSTHLPADLWTVELRQLTADGTRPYYTARPGERLMLPGRASASLLTPYRSDQRGVTGELLSRRLWIAELDLPVPVEEYLAANGFPIRYKYVRESWPGAYYQTVYANEPGSAEMPSAGRAFTAELITRLVAKGVQVAPLILHTGVASLEDHEPPYAEYYRVPVETANLVNAAHAAGKRVIAVGTTVVRALETVTGPNRLTRPGEGWTNLVITPARGLAAVDGLLTGLHEPRSSHLAMLAALAGVSHLKAAYTQALEKGYLWHEFGDLHLMLPGEK